jgi:proteasome activator subunit 3 (PA28 gamma)
MSENYKEQVSEYKENLKKEARHIIEDIFPRKVIELNALLESKKFSVSRLEELNCPPDIPIPAPILLNHNSDGQATKKRKVDHINNDVEEISGSKVLLFPNGEVPPNKHIVELVDIVKPEVIELIDYGNKIKMWITYMIPRIEDGNNFGVSIQEDTMAEARQVESEAATFLDQISRYFMTRGKIVAKVAKLPHVADIRRTIKELDEKEFISLRLVMCEMRNHYASLHDLITKNMDKIMKPRNQNTQSMY